eukprot:TRINITY_DN72063_c0_g1_i1.p1 TRINITY_DN72063_c0_g1~~TRINITY_DN72063_c0_g1_i1.p1  ORF type:complete len:791 (+),score=108.86 TRINITY_DN72063_c0_g1_i1:79-2451(+)
MVGSHESQNAVQSHVASTGTCASEPAQAINLAAEDEERQFCRQYPQYGFPVLETGGLPKINQLVQDEFSHLSGRHYLDYAGAAPVPNSVAKFAADDMLRLGNPHSLNVPGRRAAKRIRSVRNLVTQKLIGNAEDYVCVFTSGATAALKLVADCFPWRSDSQFVSSIDSHDSARGIQNIALARGATAIQITLGRSPNSMEDVCLSSGQLAAHHLFTFPGEDNITGARHDIAAWVQHTHRGLLGDGRGGRWHVCLDASKLLTCKRLILDPIHKPDFIVMSFYKIVGAPTGIGALLVRRTALPLLIQSKVYHGGGSAIVAATLEKKAKKRDGSAESMVKQSGSDAGAILEDGTLPFQQISLLGHSLQWFLRLDLDQAQSHSWSLRDYAARSMAKICHGSGAPACIMYGPPPGTCSDEVGGTVAFNLLSSDGTVLNHHSVGLAALACGLDLRWGSFCNRAGLKHALETAHGTACQDLSDPCWEPADITGARSGYLNGALRVSFGFASRFTDAQALIRFVEKITCDGQLDLKIMRRNLWSSKSRPELVERTCSEEKHVSRKRRCLFTGRCNPVDGRDTRQKFCKRIDVACSGEIPALTPLQPRPHFDTPGDRDALPARCGTIEARMEAGLAYPDACCAVRAKSIPGVCWYLHDRRHKHSVEEEFLHSVFRDESQGRTVLMVAASMGLHEMVDVLINVLGADVNHVSSTDGVTALHRAACKGHPAICELLLSSGADVNARVKDGALAGWTASQVAEWKASGDRSAHSKAHLANYNPCFGGAFAEAACVLRSAEKKV